MSRRVYALFDRPEDAMAALHEIREAGCEDEHCSAVLHQGQLDERDLTITEQSGKELAGKAGVAGAIVGAFVGGVVALGGGLIGVGPLAVALAAGGVTAAYTMLAGGISGSDDPERVLRAIQDEVEKGKSLIALETEDPELEAKSEAVFDKYGGYQILS